MQAIDEPVFRFQDKPCHSNALCGVHGHLDHSTLKAVTVGSGVYFSQRSRNLKAAVPLPRKTIRQRRFSTSRKIPVQQAIHNNISILVTSWSASNPQGSLLFRNVRYEHINYNTIKYPEFEN